MLVLDIFIVLMFYSCELPIIIKYYLPLQYDFVPWLPNVIFGVMCVIAAVITLMLPETLGRPLPQTIKEVENWTRTLSPEEKARFQAQKKAEKEKRKRLMEQEMRDVNA